MIDPSLFEVSAIDSDTFNLPSKCQYLYEQDTKIIAVTDFEDKTSFKNTIKQSGSIRYNNRSYSSSEHLYKDISAQFGEFARGALESGIVNIGGVTVAARAQMDQILREQEFQMTIADPDTAVDFGRLLGAQYIITGTIDNINASYTDPMNYEYESDGSTESIIANLVVGALSYAANTSAGWNIDVEATMNVIDVSTGEIIATKRERAKSNAGDAPGFDTEQIIAGAKKALGVAISAMTPTLASQFSPKGYINELRGEKSIALINIGTNNGVNIGDTIQPYEITVRRDFISGRESCVMTPLGFTTTVAATPESEHAWVKVNTSDDEKLKKLQIGTLVQRTEVKR
jgi:curli biogenesis system outer membrane secretion channel CsgG